jgi:FkbM family methyltransferase
MNEIGETEELIQALCRAILGRPVDPASLRAWSKIAETPGGLETVVGGLVSSPEYQARAAARSAGPRYATRLADELRPIFAEHPLIIVDVGAQALPGEQHVYAPLRLHRIAHRVVGFEPLAERREERLKQEPETELDLRPWLVGDGEVHEFHVNEPDATSSLLPFNRGVTDQFAELRQFRTLNVESVPTRTLDAELGALPAVDLLKLDIQGFELPALRHATEVLARTSVVHCEVSFAEIYAGQALFSEVEQLLRECGFEFIDFVHLCRYDCGETPTEGAGDRLGWADAVFFRAPERLACRRDFQAQALIASLLYNKSSLARALTETGERLG